MDRAKCKAIAKDTLEQLSEDHHSVKETKVYGPQQVEKILTYPRSEEPDVHIRIIKNGTVEVSEQLFNEGKKDICMLNFASAKNPGGGFLNGQPKGQEEALCRSTGLFFCLKDLRIYELARKDNNKCLYHDFVVFSPNVPVIKNYKGENLNKSFEASIITSAAPNAKHALKNRVHIKDINKVMDRRIDAVLNTAQHHKQNNLVLGAWGTGCFGNDTRYVANSFKRSLKKRKFETVVFALLSDKDIEIFKEVFNL